MRHEDKDKNPNAAAGSTITALATSLTVTPSRNVLPFKLRLSPKELKCLQEIVTTDAGMEHLKQKAAQEGIDLPASPDLPSSQESFLQSNYYLTRVSHRGTSTSSQEHYCRFRQQGRWESQQGIPLV